MILLLNMIEIVDALSTKTQNVTQIQNFSEVYQHLILQSNFTSVYSS